MGQGQLPELPPLHSLPMEVGTRYELIIPLGRHLPTAKPGLTASGSHPEENIRKNSHDFSYDNPRECSRILPRFSDRKLQRFERGVSRSRRGKLRFFHAVCKRSFP